MEKIIKVLFFFSFMKRSNSAPPSKKHNKSRKAHLSFLDMSDRDILAAWELAQERMVVTEGPVINHPCWITSTNDGRVTYNRRKIAFGYELAAFSRYKRYNLEKIPSTKKKEDLAISHICGQGPRCCNPFHLVLESKGINDERTHCHFALKNAFETGGYDNMETVYYAGICPHWPPCCFIDF